MTKWTSVCKSRKYKELGKLAKVEFRKMDFAGDAGNGKVPVGGVADFPSGKRTLLGIPRSPALSCPAQGRGEERISTVHS